MDLEDIALEEVVIKITYCPTFLIHHAKMNHQTRGNKGSGSQPKDKPANKASPGSI
jgi:hypothetical protein